MWYRGCYLQCQQTVQYCSTVNIYYSNIFIPDYFVPHMLTPDTVVLIKLFPFNSLSYSLRFSYIYFIFLCSVYVYLSEYINTESWKKKNIKIFHNIKTAYYVYFFVKKIYCFIIFIERNTFIFIWDSWKKCMFLNLLKCTNGGAIFFIWLGIVRKSFWSWKLKSK